MSFSVKLEEVSPSQAHAYLAQSAGNRSLNADYVLSLGVAMETGRWTPEASEIVFDDSGALVDGHHRLNAIVAVGKTVPMLVKRGVPKSARGVIDTGRSRNIKDLMHMFRNGQTMVSQRRATLNACVTGLVPGRVPPIRTLDAWDAWYKVFATGVDFVTEAASSTRINALRTGPVTGAFAFAHPTAPRKVEALFLSMIDGAGLERGDAIHTTRNAIMAGAGGLTSGNQRHATFRKCLQGIYFGVRGEGLAKLQDGSKGLEHFRKAYAGRTEKLVALWTHPGVASDA